LHYAEYVTIDTDAPENPRSARPDKSGSGPRKAAAIFNATLDLLAESGYERLTIEAVAARSGVNKTTIYRWWKSKGALVGAALLGSRRLDLAVPDTGSLRGDLAGLLRTVLALLTEAPTGPVAVAVLGAATHSEELAGYVRGFFADRLGRERPLFARAVARGELPADTDPMLLVDLLAGAAWLRVVFRAEQPDADFVDRAVHTVLHGARSRYPD
jgi:AcrR family transcriptional regulator